MTNVIVYSISIKVFLFFACKEVFMWHILIGLGILITAIMAIRAKRLLVAALWLAGTSALVALMIYLMGAPHIAVIELSVGAGLVTVLFVFAINIAGEEAFTLKSIIPKPVAWGLIILALGLAGWLLLPNINMQMLVFERLDLAEILWKRRYIDLILQVVLVFSGILGVLGLIGPERKKSTKEEKAS